MRWVWRDIKLWLGQVSNDMASRIVISIVPAGGSGATVTGRPMESSSERASGESCSRLDRNPRAAAAIACASRLRWVPVRRELSSMTLRLNVSLLNQGRTHSCKLEFSSQIFPTTRTSSSTHQTAKGLFGCAHDRLAAYFEAGVDQCGHSLLRFEG
jgi:hypothetical protein